MPLSHKERFASDLTVRVKQRCLFSFLQSRYDPFCGRLENFTPATDEPWSWLVATQRGVEHKSSNLVGLVFQVLLKLIYLLFFLFL